MPLTLEKLAIERAAGDLRFRTESFIGGRFLPALSGNTFPTENPATGKPLANIAACDREDIDRAANSARAAFEKGGWSRRSPADRKKILLKLADLIERHDAEFALLDCLEAGKPIADCVKIDVPDSITAIRWHAEAIDKIYDRVAPTAADNLGLIVREPLGVVGCVIPWNFPLMMAALKLAPALAAGNSVILKPAEQTSLSALRLGELAAEAGLPDGVLNVVPGFGEMAGQAIGRHLDIDMVSFTGSTEIGRLFLKYSAESNLKRVTLECGGKSPQIVMADAADLDLVAGHAVNAAFWNMGENCSCGSRLLVHRDVKDQLLHQMIVLSREWMVGNPLDPATRVGALIEQPHLRKVLGYIDAGCVEGAEIVLGGKQVLAETGGYFVAPTIFDRVRNDMRLARDEIFGPVLSTIAFSTREEAIEIANDTPYGLAASLYTNNVDTAHRLARAIRAGTVSVNCYSEGDFTTPFGGYKQSGFAGRDKSVLAHEQYTEVKTIWMQFRQ